MRYLARLCIRLYQYTISPLLGPVCRFTPSCSNYALEAFQKYSFPRALWLSISRIVRCNPWCGCGGHDPVP